MINIDNFKNQVNCLMNIGILEHFTNYKLFCEMFFTSLSQDIFRKLHVSGTASYEITLVHLCICQSVCLSLSFFKIGSLVFSNIVHDDSWPGYPLTDRARFLNKKNLAAWICAKWIKIRPKTKFLDIFWSLVH